MSKSDWEKATWDPDYECCSHCDEILEAGDKYYRRKELGPGEETKICALCFENECAWQAF